MAIPGFGSAVRYEAIEGAPRYPACYFLDDIAALETPRYLCLNRVPGERTERMLASVRGFTRYVCDETSDTGPAGEEPGAVFAVAFGVPDDREERAALDAWYEGEHIPLLMEVPGWQRVRRYVVRRGADGPPWTHLALHYLRSADALDRPERAAARDTPRRAALAARPWFGANGRWVYRPIHKAVAETFQT